MTKKPDPAPYVYVETCHSCQAVMPEDWLEAGWWTLTVWGGCPDEDHYFFCSAACRQSFRDRERKSDGYANPHYDDTSRFWTHND